MSAAITFAALAGRRNRDSHVAGLAQRLDLTRKYLFKTEIIARSGERRSIGGQGDRRDRDTVVLVADRQLSRDMLGVGRTASIAKEH